MPRRWSSTLMASAVLVSCGCASSLPPPTQAAAPLPPDLAQGETPVRTVATGHWSTCALLADETVWCWGDEHDGTVGVNDGWPRQIPLEHVVQVEAAGEATYAVTREGRLYFWGREGDGPRFVSTNVPLRSNLEGVLEVAVSETRVCVRRHKGRVSCWDKSQRALQTLPVTGARALEVYLRVDSAGDIRVGSDHACAVVRGAVWCWGSNTFGQLGFDGDDAPESVRVSLGDLASLRAARAVSVSSTHRCVLGLDGHVRCWGHNDEGQLGTGDRRPRSGHTPMGGGLGEVISVSAGPNRTCAVRAGGEVACFGTALGPPQGSPSPGGGAPGEAVAVTVGGSHACVLDRDGGARCWGDNDSGQLGTGDLTPSRLPRRVVGTDRKPLARIVKVKAFEAHSCAIDADGKLLCWGANRPAEQGRPYNGPPRIEVATPVAIPGRIVDVSSSCALDDKGVLRCWGPAFPSERDLAFSPARTGLCEATRVTEGFCSAHEDGTLRCLGAERYSNEKGGERGGIQLALGHILDLSGNGEEVCAIDGEHHVTCLRGSSSDWSTSVGTTTGAWMPWPSRSAACPSDAPPTSLPRFPPAPFVTVTADVAGDEQPGKALSPDQVRRLLEMINDPASFVSISTCVDEGNAFTFRDADGRSVAYVVPSSCGTFVSAPLIPAQARVGGNMITPRATRTIRALCRELGMLGCS